MRLIAAFLFFLTSAATLCAVPVAYVTNYDTNKVSVVDVLTGSVTGYVNNGSFLISNPVDVRFVPNGSKAYLVSDSSNAVFVIDTATNTIVSQVDSNGFPFNAPVCIAIKPDASIAYVSNEGSNKVSIINLTTNKVTGYLSDPHSTINLPVGIAISADGKQAYVANFNGNSVSIVDTSLNKVVASVSNGSNVLDHPTEVIYTSDTLVSTSIPLPILGGALTIGLPSTSNTTAYVNSVSANRIFLIDVASGAITGVVDDSSVSFSTPISFASSSSGSLACNYTANEVSIIDPSLNHVSNTVSGTFNLPAKVRITPDKTTAYVTNLGDNTVSIVNLLTGIVIGHLNDASYPFSKPYALDIVNR